MMMTNRVMNLMRDRVDVFLALTEFARQKFIQGGLPAESIITKPNFVEKDPGAKSADASYALFVGRLTREKGVLTLLEAIKRLPGVPLKIVGKGPLGERLERVVHRYALQNVEILGHQHREEVIALMKKARFLIFPSEWYEACPMTILEAFACGLPVITTALGAMGEMVEDEKTGLLAQPGNSESLAERMEWAWSHESRMVEMGRNARAEYLRNYTAERNYQRLMDVYRIAAQRAKARFE